MKKNILSLLMILGITLSSTNLTFAEGYGPGISEETVEISCIDGINPTRFSEEDYKLISTVMSFGPEGKTLTVYEIADLLGVEPDISPDGTAAISPLDLFKFQSMDEIVGFDWINNYSVGFENGVKTYTIIPGMGYDISDYNNKLYNIINELGINENTSKRQAVELFNQYICDNFTYDLQYRYFNMLDFLNAKSGVCHHFAKLFDDLCHICGIECKYITGRSVQDGHAWNSVNLNGQTLYVDTTWNLTGWDDETYLLLDESTFNLSHGNYKINFEK